jgi:hypothetical protein
MQFPPLDPPVSDVAPAERSLTGYDQRHLVIYLRQLNADAEGADWQEVARIVLHIDAEREPVRAKRAWDFEFILHKKHDIATANLLSKLS